MEPDTLQEGEFYLIVDGAREADYDALLNHLETAGEDEIRGQYFYIVRRSLVVSVETTRNININIK